MMVLLSEQQVYAFCWRAHLCACLLASFFDTCLLKVLSIYFGFQSTGLPLLSSTHVAAKKMMYSEFWYDAWQIADIASDLSMHATVFASTLMD